MGFYVDFTVKRGGYRQKGIEISYLYNGSKENLNTDYTDKNGEVRTDWSDIWKNREVDVFFDGGNKRKITLKPRDSHTINLPSGCFPYETKIYTPFGLQCIGDMSDGDHVFSFDPTNGRLTIKRIIKKLVHKPMRVVEVRTKNNKPLYVTKSHRLLTSRGYVAVANLKNGDYLSVHSGSSFYTALDRVEETERVETVYNLIVADSFSFIANGFVAHSFTNAPKLQEVVWKIYDLSCKIHITALVRKYFQDEFRPLRLF